MSIFMLDVDGSRESSNILTIPLFTDGIFLVKFEYHYARNISAELLLKSVSLSVFMNVLKCHLI